MRWQKTTDRKNVHRLTLALRKTLHCNLIPELYKSLSYKRVTLIKAGTHPLSSLSAPGEKCTIIRVQSAIFCGAYKIYTASLCKLTHLP